MLMPHAMNATDSRSDERRPNAISRPMSSAIGIVIASACGMSVTRTRTTIVHETPFEISCSL